MKTEFICPNQERIKITDCLKKCPYTHRCLSPSTLALIADDRPFTGVSPSMAGKGDRQIYLENMVDFAIDPRSKMFMTYGTRHHMAKEGYAGEYGEYSLDGGGTIDDYDKKTKTLYDSKFVGTGRLDRIAVKVWVETGEVYKVNYKDKKKGDKKVKPIVGNRWDISDDHDWVRQLNFYRIKLENMGYTVENIFVEATIRDGGTGIAIGKGYTDLVYMIPIQIVEDNDIYNYYEDKESGLREKMTMGTPPPICEEKERWNDNIRCAFYCDVFEECGREGGWEYSTLRKIVKKKTHTY